MTKLPSLHVLDVRVTIVWLRCRYVDILHPGHLYKTCRFVRTTSSPLWPIDQPFSRLHLHIRCSRELTELPAAELCEDELSSDGAAGDEPGDESHAAAGYRPHGGGESVLSTTLLLQLVCAGS